jgi:predicted DNA-binding transcriptional regulator AlpA
MAKFIRANQMEEVFGIDRITAWRWSHNPKHGFPRAIRLSSKVSLYDAELVETWIKNHSTEPVNDRKSMTTRTRPEISRMRQQF